MQSVVAKNRVISSQGKVSTKRGATRACSRKRARNLLSLAAAGAIGSVLSQRATAAVDTWGGLVDNDWANLNWNTANSPAVPVSGDSLVFTAQNTQGNLTLADTLTNNAFNIAGITFNSGALAYTMTGNTFVLTGGITNNSTSLETINNPFSMTAVQTFTTLAGGGNITLGGSISGAGGGITAAGVGTLTVSGTDSYTGITSVTGGATINLAAGAITASNSLNDTNGTFNITSGGSFTAAAGTSFIGNTVGGTATLNVTSGTFATGGNEVDIGDVGTGIMNVNGGNFTNTSTTNGVFVGNGNTTSAILNLSSGNVSISQLSVDKNLSTAGAAAFLNQSGGTLTINNTSGNSNANYFRLNRSGSAGTTGVYNITGGTLNSQADVLMVTAGNGNATVNIGGGTLLVGNGTNTSSFHLGGALITNNQNAVAIVNQAGGNLTIGAASLQGLWYNSAASTTGTRVYTYNLAGGTLTTPKVTVDTNVGTTSSFNFNGGTLAANAATSSGTPLLGGNLTSATIFAGGATINTGGFATTINQALLAPAGNGLFSIGLGSGGTGYNGSPLVTISGGGGTGAAAVANLTNGVITSFTITNPGAGYTSVPTITIAGDGGTGATATATIAADALTGGLTVTGGNTLILTGNSTYQGPTVVSAGTLQAGVATNGTTSGAFGVNSAVTLVNASGATLALNNFSNSIGSLTGGGASGGNVTLGSATLTVGTDNTSPAAYAGVISGTGSLTKVGAGTLSLSGVNTYGGRTSVNGGTLTLAFGGASTNILASGSALTLGGGNLNITGAGNQTLNGLTTTANTGSSIVLSGTNEILTLGALASAGGNSSLNFNTAAGGGNATAASLGTDIVVLTGQTAGTAINRQFTVTDAGGFGLATVNASNNVIRSTTTTLLPASGSVSSTNYLINNNAGGSAAAGSSSLAITGNESAGSITVDTTAASGVLTLNSGVVLSNDVWNFGGTGSNTYQITGSTSGAGINSVASGDAISFNNSGAGNVTVASPIIANGTNAVTFTGGTFNLTGSYGTTGLLVDNATLNLPNGASTGAAQVDIGDVANGVMNITGGSFTNTNVLVLGNAGSGSGIVNVSGGNVSLNQLFVQSSGATGGNDFFNQSGGNISANVNGGNTIRIGRGNLGGSGTYNLTGGTLTVLTGTDLTIASNANSTGVLNVGGTGNLAFTGTASLDLDTVTANGSNTAVVNQTGGTVTLASTATNGVWIGNENASPAYNLQAGTLTTPFVKSNGTGNFNFNGGTLAANGNSTTFLTGLASTTIYSGGGTINTNGNAITIGQALLAPTGNGITNIALTANGSGYFGSPLVTISGGNGTGAAAVANVVNGVITGFTITNPGQGYTSAPTVTLTGDLAVGGTAATLGAVTTAANTSGGLTVTGNGTLTLNNANSSYSGGTVISGGLLISSTAVPNVGTNSSIGTGNLTVNGGTFRAAAGGNTNRTIAIGSSGGTLDTNVLMFYSGSFTGSGNLTFLDSSHTTQQWLITGSSPNFSGNVFVGDGVNANSGFIQYRSNLANPFGNGTVQVNKGGIVSADNNSVTNFPSTLANNFVLNGGALGTQAPAMTYTGTVSLTGNSTVGNPVGNTGNVTFTNTISGTAALTVASNSSVTFSGNNTYSGDTIVNTGTLTAGVSSVVVSGNATSGAFGVNSAITLANVAGVTLNFNGFNEQIGSLAGGGTTGGNVTLGSGTLTTGQNGTSTTFAGVVSGTGGLTKIGNGTETLSGNNSYTGGTTVNAGTLTVTNTTGSATGSGFVQVNGGAILTGTGSISGPVTVAAGNTSATQGTISLLPTSVLTLGNLTLGDPGGNSSNLLFQLSGNTSNKLVISGPLTMNAGGAIVALQNQGIVGNTIYTLATFADTGSTFNGGNFTSGTGPSVDGFTTAAAPFGTTSNSLTVTVNSLGNDTLQLTTGGVNPAPTQAYWTGAVGSSWNSLSGSTANFATTNTGETTVGNYPAATTDVYFAASVSGNMASNLTNTLGQNFDIQSLTFLATDGSNNTIAAINIGGTVLGQNTLQLEGGNGNGTSPSFGNSLYNANVNGVTLGMTTIVPNVSQTWTNALGAGNLTINSAVTGTATVGNSTLLTLVNNSANPITLSGVLGDGTGGGNLAVTVSNAATRVVNLTAANSFSGPLTINSGIVNVGSLGNSSTNSPIGFGASAASLVLNGGTLQYTGTTAQSTNRLFTLGTSGTIDGSGNGATALVTFTGNTALSFSGTGPRTLTLTGTNIGNVLTVGAGESISYNSFSPVIADQSAGNQTTVVKSGAGGWILASSNSYSGGTQINAGDLELKNAGALGSGNVTVAAGAALLFNLNGQTVPNNITLNGLTTSVNGLSGALVGDNLGGGGGNVLAGTLTLASTSNVTTSWVDKTLTLAGQVTGPGGLQVDLYHAGNNPAIVILGNSTNNFQGGVIINGGTTLQTNAAGVIPSGNGTGNVAINGTTSILNLNGNSQSINGLNGNGTVNASTGNATLTLGLSNGNATFAGLLNNNGGILSLTKAGTGTQTLTGNSSTYSGGTLISGGVLISSTAVLNGNSSIGTGNLTVNGGTFRAAAGGNTNRTIAIGASGGTLDTNLLMFYNGNLTGSGNVTFLDSSHSNQQWLITGSSPNFSGNVFVGDGANATSGFIQYRSNLANPFGNGTIQVNTGGTVSADNGTTNPSTLANNFVLNGGLLATQTPAMTYTGTVSLTGNSTVGNTSGGPTNNSGTLTFTNTISGTAALTVASNSSVTFSGNNTYSGNTIVNTGNLTAGVSSVIASGNATSGAFGVNSAITLANVAGVALNLNGFNEQIGSLAGGGTTGGNVTLGSGTLTTGQNGTSTTFAGVVSGTGGLTKIGAGNLSLSNAANSFTGNITINGGALSATSAGTNDGNTDLGNDATAGRTITLNNAGTVLSFTINNVFGGTPTAAKVPIITIGNGTKLTTTRFNPLGAVVLNGGTLENNLASSATDGAFQGYAFLGNITVGGSAASSITATNGSTDTLSNGSTTNFNVADATGDANPDLIVSIGLGDKFNNGGAGALSKSGVGTMLLSGANTFTGQTTISAGTLAVNAVATGANPQPLGENGNLTVGGSSTSGTLLYTGGNGTLDKSITIGAGSGTISNTGGGVLSLTGGIIKNAAVLNLSGGSFVVSTVGISGSSTGSDLNVIGGAIVGETVANTYNGPTSISGNSTLLAGVDNVLPNSGGNLSALTLGAATDTSGMTNTLDLLGGNQTVASLSATGTATNQIISSNGSATTPAIGGSASSGAGSLTIAYSGNSTNTFGGTLGGAGTATNFSVIKTGTGEVNLNGVNSYTGSTSVNAGTLRTTNLTGAVIVGTGSAGSGTIAVGPNATTPGTLASASTHTWQGGGTYQVKINDTGNATDNSASGPGLAGGTGTGNTGWDLITAAGISTANTGTPFEIQLVSTVTPTGSFNSASPYTWIIASFPDSFSTNISVGSPLATTDTNGSPATSAAFALDTSNFVTANGSAGIGTYQLELVDVSGTDSLEIQYSGAPEPGTTILVLGGAVPMLMGRRRRREKKLAN